jgi:hypothetical protein
MVCRREFGAHVVTCQNGHENPDGYSFCGSCGEALAPAPKPDPTVTEQPLWPSPATRADRKRQMLIGGVAVAAVLVVLGVGGGLALAGVFDSGSSTPASLSSLEASWARYLYVRTVAVNNEQARQVRNNVAAVRRDFRQESDAARVLAYQAQAIKFPTAVRSDVDAFVAAARTYRSEVEAAAGDPNGLDLNAHLFTTARARNALDVAYFRLVGRLQAQ